MGTFPVPAGWNQITLWLRRVRAWLSFDAPEESESAPLGETLLALDHLEPRRARFLAAFAYLLGRVARADLQMSTEETRAMEALRRTPVTAARRS